MKADINKLEHYLTRIGWLMMDVRMYRRFKTYNESVLDHQYGRLTRIWNRLLDEMKIK